MAQGKQLVSPTLVKSDKISFMARPGETIENMHNRQKAYAEFVSKQLKGEIVGSPFVALPPERSDVVQKNIPEVRKRSTLLQRLREVMQAMKKIESGGLGEPEQDNLLKQLRSEILPWIVQLDNWEEETAILGAPPEEAQKAGFSDADEIITEKEILLFVYGGSTINIPEIVSELEILMREKVEAERVAQSAKDAEDARLEAIRIAEEAEAARIASEDEASRRKELKKTPENLPNDFFRYLLQHDVPAEYLVSENAPEDPRGRERFLREKYENLGNIFLSVIVQSLYDKGQINPNFLSLTDIQTYQLESFSTSKNPNAYTVQRMIEIVTNEIKRVLGADEEDHAKKMKIRLQSATDVLGVIEGTSKKFSGAGSNAALQGMYSPIPDADKGQERVPTWWDKWFFKSVIGDINADGTAITNPGDLQNIQFMFPDSTSPINWTRVERNLGDLLVGYMGQVIQQSYIPPFNGPIKLPDLLTGFPEHLRYGTSHFFNGNISGHEVWSPKIVMKEVSSPRSMFPYAVEPGDGKENRVSTFQNIIRRYQRRPEEYPFLQFIAMHSANALDVQLTTAFQDGQLKPKGAWEDLLGKKLDEAMADGTFQRAATEVTETLNLGPSGLNIPGYADGEYQLTKMQRWFIEGKLTQYVLGVRYVDKVANLSGYAEKVFTSPGSQESQFNNQTIGLFKSFILPYGEYLIDYKSGLTLNQMFVAYAGGDRSMGPKIVNLVSGNSTQAHSNHLRDALTLTETTLSGLKAGTILNIAEVDLKKNLVNKLNTEFIAQMRAFYRVLYGYHYSRDSLAPKEVESEFFAGTGGYDNLGEHFIVVRVKDNKSGRIGQKLMRSHKFYHLFPHDLYQMADTESLGPNSRGVWSDDFRGVRVMEIQVDDASKVPAFDGADLDKFLKGYVDTLMMRHLIKNFIYVFSKGTELMHMKTHERLLLGMVFSEEIRENFKAGKYTRGIVSETLVSVAKTYTNIFGDLDIEIPDLAGPNLFTEKQFYEVMKYAGYKREFSEFLDDMQKSVSGDVFK